MRILREYKITSDHFDSLTSFEQRELATTLDIEPTVQEVIRFYGSQILSMLIRVGSKGKAVIDPQKLDPWRIDKIPDWALTEEEVIERRQEEMEKAFQGLFASEESENPTDHPKED